MNDERWSDELTGVHRLVNVDEPENEKPLSPREYERLTSIKWCLFAIITFYLLIVIVVGLQLIQNEQNVLVDETVFTVLE